MQREDVSVARVWPEQLAALVTDPQPGAGGAGEVNTRETSRLPAGAVLHSSGLCCRTALTGGRAPNIS